VDFRTDFRSEETKMIHRAALAVLALSLATGAAFAQATQPAGDKNKEETNCTTSSAATSGSGEEKTKNSMTVGNSAILPEAGGANSAAPTVQSGDKPMVARKDCPPDSKPKS
jgi:opacity protein-like surface antigen